MSGEFDDFYIAEPSVWYRSLPYGFEAWTEKGVKRFYLPINPQNITIVTHFATNIIATMDSTVEEHSNQRYFDITIQGHTGFAPRYSGSFQGGIGVINQNAGRSSYGSENFMISVKSLTRGLIDNKIDEVGRVFKSIGGTVSPFLPKEDKKLDSGVIDTSSGYVAFHNLYKFFLSYKKNTANRSDIFVATESPLMFLNYKDGNKYSCAINRFTLERSSDNPMLYNYAIQLRAYDIRPIGQTKEQIEKLYAKYGLGKGSSTLTKDIKKSMGSVRSSIAGAKNLVGMV